MMISTLHWVEGDPVSKQLGVVTGQHSYGLNIFQHVWERFVGAFGGRAHGPERAMRAVREQAIETMCTQAEELGADAVLGYGCSYSLLAGGRIVVATASGTAVKFADNTPR